MSTTDRILGTIASAAGDAPSPAEMAALLSALHEEARLLARQEIELARAELRASSHHATGAGAGFGAAALIGYLALAVLAVAAALGLSEVLPASVAFLVVGVVLAAVAGIAFLAGRRSLQAFSPMPKRAIHNIKEDLTWLRTQVS